MIDAGKPQKIWIDTRLSAEHMRYLNTAIATSLKEQEGKDWKENAAGNVSRSTLIDKDNWFYENVLKNLAERMFFCDWDNYRKYVINKDEILQFELFEMWVNFQKKHDHVPLHDHGSTFSFVIFLRIPTHWKDQHVPTNHRVKTQGSASNFEFTWTKMNSERCMTTRFRLCSEDEGRMLFFPSWLKHQVYPFYECEEDRITISGNIILVDPNEPMEKSQDIPVDKNNEKMIKILENNIKVMKKELEGLKKEREKEGSI